MLRKIGFSLTQFYAHGGLFESAFRAGFVDQTNALVSIGGPGMGSNGKWTAEAAAELANVGTLAHRLCRNLFPARQHSGSDQDAGAFNRKFENEAKEAKRAENLAALEKMITSQEISTTKEHLGLKLLHAARTGLVSLDTSKGSKSKDMARRARTSHGRSFFPAMKVDQTKKRKENEVPNGKNEQRDSHGEKLKGLVRRVTGSWRGR